MRPTRRQFVASTLASLVPALPCGLKELPPEQSEESWSCDWKCYSYPMEHFLEVRFGNYVLVEGILFTVQVMVPGRLVHWTFRVGSIFYDLGVRPLEEAKILAGYKLAEWMKQAKVAMDKTVFPVRKP